MRQGRIAARVVLRIGMAVAVLLTFYSPAQAEPPSVRPEVLAPYVLDQTWREAVQSVPVVVKTADSREHKTTFQLSFARPPGDGPFPLVIFLHGRNEARDYPSRYRPIGIAQTYFLRRGFAVMSPTRVGYGGLGTRIDPESGYGYCSDASVEQQVLAVQTQLRAIIEHAKQQPWVDASRIVLAGQSVGGYTAIAAAARGLDGVVAVFNFSGGAGANRKGPAHCPERITRVFRTAGKKLRLPTLWVYGDNDPFWGYNLARTWHQAFVAAGGMATFVGIPYVPIDGHSPISLAAQHWRPHADRLLAPLGIKPPRATNAPPATAFARLNDFGMLRSNNNDIIPVYQRFLNSDYPRAFAFSPGGGWSWSNGEDAIGKALASCEAANKRACKLYAVDDSVVWVP
jgi:dienelactone hydrolase